MTELELDFAMQPLLWRGSHSLRRLGGVGSVKPLEPPDSHHLRAAEGWLELECPGQTIQELRKIKPPLCSHPDVLEVQWRVCARAKLWNACVEIGSTLLELDSGRASGWLSCAYALRRAAGDGLRVAWVALLPAAEKFPELPLIPFNLACYAAQMGRLAEAWCWLHRALAIAERAGYQNRLWLRALHEPDLDLLWQGIGGIGHKSFQAGRARLMGFKS